jgi:hypothetical protein
MQIAHDDSGRKSNHRQAPTLSPYRNRPLKRRAPNFRAEAPNPSTSDIEDVTVDTVGGRRRLLTLLELEGTGR